MSTTITAVIAESRRAVGDVGPLVRFRFAGMRDRGRRVASITVGAFVALTIAVVVTAGYWPGAGTAAKANDMLILLPSAYIAFLLTTTMAIIGSGGGRELLPREQAVAFPVSPITDHIGALLLAPLNIAWIIQAWSLLGATAFVTGPHRLILVALSAMVWLLVATCVAQAVAWCVEFVRRGPFGLLLVRGLFAVVVGAVAVMVATGSTAHIVDRISAKAARITIVVTAPAGSGKWGTWALGLAIMVAVGVAALALGGLVATRVARRSPREEARAEGQAFTPRPLPRSEYAALVRTDRGSVWRSVPLRRGFAVLGLLPGLVAAGGQLRWEMMPILPGLVAAGGALLFGINAWCLDGVGALWRDSLPVDPQLAMLARMQVLLEILLAATALTICVAALRAGGEPTATQLNAVVATTVVVSVQVVARSMQWSVRRPYAMDLRSARGTPAPPFAMLAYSSWLAMSSTVTGLVFGIASHAHEPSLPVVLAMPFLIAAVRRILITAREWADPDIRARVVATVSAR
jgi:hypothetical protein